MPRDSSSTGFPLASGERPDIHIARRLDAAIDDRRHCDRSCLVRGVVRLRFEQFGQVAHVEQDWVGRFAGDGQRLRSNPWLGVGHEKIDRFRRESPGQSLPA